MNERLTSGVAILCLVLLYFWGNGALSVTAPVEVNYAQTAKEMLAAGDYLSPQIYGNYWYDKPIFFYWELIAAFSVFGVDGVLVDDHPRDGCALLRARKADPHGYEPLCVLRRDTCGVLHRLL